MQVHVHLCVCVHVYVWRCIPSLVQNYAIDSHSELGLSLLCCNTGVLRREFLLYQSITLWIPAVSWLNVWASVHSSVRFFFLRLLGELKHRELFLEYTRTMTIRPIISHCCQCYDILSVRGINSNGCLSLRYVCDTVRDGIPACKEFTLCLNGLRQKTNCWGSRESENSATWKGMASCPKGSKARQPHSMAREMESMRGFLEEVLSDEWIGRCRRRFSAVPKLG